MTLYQATDEDGNSRFYWANSRNHAADMFIEQLGKTKMSKSKVEVNIVWADNDDARYRGFVTMEDYE